jgi:hypothetical protein
VGDDGYPARLAWGEEGFPGCQLGWGGGTADLPQGGVDVLTGKRRAAGRVKVDPFGCLAVVCG